MTPARTAAKTGPAAAKAAKPVVRKPPAPKASGPAKRAKPVATSPIDDLKAEARERAKAKEEKSEVAAPEVVKFPRSPEVLEMLVEISKEYAGIDSDLPARVLKHVLPVVLGKCDGDLGKLMDWHKEIVGLLSYYKSRVGNRYVANFAGSDYHGVGVLPVLVAACESPKDLYFAASFLQFFEDKWMRHDEPGSIGAPDNFLKRVVPKILAKAKTPEERSQWRVAITAVLNPYLPFILPNFAGNVLPAMLDKCETPADLAKWNEKVNFVVGIDCTGSGARIDVTNVVSRGLPALIEACADLKEFERVTGSSGVYGYANSLGDATEFMVLLARSLKSA